jgi:hypothetical protein
VKGTIHNEMLFFIGMNKQYQGRPEDARRVINASVMAAQNRTS